MLDDFPFDPEVRPADVADVCLRNGLGLNDQLHVSNLTARSFLEPGILALIRDELPEAVYRKEGREGFTSEEYTAIERTWPRAATALQSLDGGRGLSPGDRPRLIRLGAVLGIPPEDIAEVGRIGGQPMTARNAFLLCAASGVQLPPVLDQRWQFILQLDRRRPRRLQRLRGLSS